MGQECRGSYAAGAERGEGSSQGRGSPGPYRPWYPKAVDVLEDDWERMAFYDFPEDHWKHLRTTNGD